MKRKVIVLLLLLILILASCAKKESPLLEILREVEITFVNSGDDFNNVTGDFFITRSSLLYEDALLLWDLSSLDYATINNDLVIITRPDDEDENLTLTLTIIYNNEELSEKYNFTIKYDEGELVFPTDPANPNDTKVTYYTITYRDEKKSFKKEKYEKGTKVILNEGRAKEGYTFYGWLLGSSFITEVTLTKNITLDAVYNNDLYKRDNIEEELAINDLADLYIRHYFFNQEKMDWDKKGIRGSSFTYQIDAEYLKYFDFTKNIVTPPKDEYLIFNALVTAKNGDFETNRLYQLNLGQPPLSNISDVKYDGKESFAKIAGTITGSYVENKIEYYFLQNETEATKIMTTGSYSLPIGLTAEIIVWVKADELEIMNYEVIKKQIKIEPLYVYDEQTINNNLNKMIYSEGTVTKSLENKVFEIFLHKKFKAYLKTNETKTIVSKMYLNFIGYITVIDGEEVIIITQADTISLEKREDSELLELIMGSLNFNSQTINLTTDLLLPDKDFIFNSSITWKTNNDKVIIENNILIYPADIDEFTLTAVVKLDNQTTLERNFRVVIKP